MKRMLTFLSLFFILGCSEKYTLEPAGTVSNFNIELPVGWKHIKTQGDDSKVGFFTDGTDSLYYDFGMFTNGFTFFYGNDPEYAIKKIIIDKKPGQWLYPHKSGDGITGVFLRADSVNTLTITARSKNSNSYYLNIFRTIKFVRKEN